MSSQRQHKINNPYSYGIVIDCGSSGSRVFVYKWDPNVVRENVDKTIKQVTDSRDRVRDLGGKDCKLEKCPVVKKVEPGISDFISTPEKAADQIEDLLSFAENFIPKYKKPETVTYIYATAGLRMEKASERSRLLSIMRRRVSKNFPFILENPDVISGESEGLYAWMAINSIKGTLCPENSHEKQMKSVAVMDMGGGSMQIVIPMNESQVAKMEARFRDKNDKYASSLNSHIEKIDNLPCSSSSQSVFIKTWLGIGANKARKRYEEYMLKPNETDPCVNLGLSLNGIRGVEGNFEKCREKLSGHNIFDTSQFNHDGTDADPEHPCKRNLSLLDCLYRAPSPSSQTQNSEDGTKVNDLGQIKKSDLVCGHEISPKQLPDIDFKNMELIGLSEFYYTTHDTFQISGEFDADKFHRKAYDWCKTPNLTHYEMDQMKKAKEGMIIDDKNTVNSEDNVPLLYQQFSVESAQYSRIQSECFKSAWVSTVLKEGLGFPILNPEKFKMMAIDSFEHQDLQWTLGALLDKILKKIALENKLNQPLGGPLGSIGGLGGLAGKTTGQITNSRKEALKKLTRSINNRKTNNLNNLKNNHENNNNIHNNYNTHYNTKDPHKVPTVSSTILSTKDWIQRGKSIILLESNSEHNFEEHGHLLGENVHPEGVFTYTFYRSDLKVKIFSVPAKISTFRA